MKGGEKMSIEVDTWKISSRFKYALHNEPETGGVANGPLGGLQTSRRRYGPSNLRLGSNTHIEQPVTRLPNNDQTTTENVAGTPMFKFDFNKGAFVPK